MRVKNLLSVSGVLLCGLSLALPAAATTSIWPARETTQSAMIVDDYLTLTCPRTPPAAYTGHLQLDSKYDQSDATKTTLTPLSRDTRRVRDHITSFNRGLVEIVSRFERADNPMEANIALACLHVWLEAWAQGKALLSTDVSGTGRAVRKWSLAAISSSLLKVRALSNQRYSLSSSQLSWLQQLSEAVMHDYGPRQTLDYAWFNNHDYWAAWAISATGMLLERDDYMRFSDKTLRLALQQMRPGDGDYRYLPLEMDRGKLAIEYTHYALVPLVFLAEAAEVNGARLTADEWTRLGQLVNLAALGVLREESIAELTHAQSEVPAHKMIWLLPFMARQPEHALAQELFGELGSSIGHYGQVGGDLRHLYPGID
ncbi:alginate lyase family protein [Halopseudomonas salegens]|uniref:Poly(Beta-D-mannuronate) lyase n=1 Tax=Halopseudomonas salegens TaxID=1434072 RepID=A0A1H2HTH7_9GAMM|nr:alginate lyase family protein [Halopseudomonas salegens]SDU35016.1 poly(beta-D-mannuronate) lyase [Halopseudomonas salegens]